MQLSTVVHTLLHSHWPIFGAWTIGAGLTVLVPLIKWGKDRRFFYKLYGRYIEYEQAQRAYQRAQENNNDNNNQNYNNNNSYGTSPYNCRWWQFRCQRDERNYLQYYAANNNNNNERQDNRQIYTPRWYQLLGGRATEEDRREQEERGEELAQASPALKFVYWWTLILFVSLVACGGYMLYKKRSLHYVAILLACMTQNALLMMILMPQGVISTDDRELEDSYYGWYGQWGVLMVYFYYGQVLFGVFFLVLGAIKIYYEKRILGSTHSWGEPEKEEPLHSGGDEAQTSYKNADKVMYIG